MRGMKTNLLHLQVEKLWGGMYMWGAPNASENIHSGMTQYLGLQESENVPSLLYIIHDGDYDINLYTDKILLLMYYWDFWYCMDVP